MSPIDRNLAAELGHQTLEILRSGAYTTPTGRHVSIRAALEQAVRDTVEYPPGEDPVPRQRQHAKTRFTVVNETVLSVGRRMAANGSVAALNFAAAGSPGGGFLSGARAQEESIARSSGLFAALEGRRMYAFHRERQDAMYTDYVIYSPDVPVFRVDSGELLEEPWTMSIVTCPAVNGRALLHHAPHRAGDVEAIMVARTNKMLAVAEAHGVRRFILGAWGCGAFGLEPGMMAGIFDDAFRSSYLGAFDEVVFAVTDWSPNLRTMTPFQERFGR